jgi:hypothetical protein
MSKKEQEDWLERYQQGLNHYVLTIPIVAIFTLPMFFMADIKTALTTALAVVGFFGVLVSVAAATYKEGE